MAKAILVMDMPKNCFACDLESYGECKAMFGEVIENKFEKPSWCPLKPMPEKETICGKYNSEYYANGGKMPSWKLGFNACIDAICGKE